VKLAITNLSSFVFQKLERRKKKDYPKNKKGRIDNPPHEG